LPRTNIATSIAVTASLIVELIIKPSQRIKAAPDTSI
jgi:hypothetical protein